MENYKLENEVIFSNYTGTDDILCIPEGTTQIGDCGETYTVRQLILPEGVKCIRFRGLAQFYALEHIHLPASLEVFDRALDRQKLTWITLAANSPRYTVQGNCLIDQEEGSLILGCKNSIIPDDGSVRTIAGHALSLVKLLKQVHIPKSVRQIDGTAFFASGLETITVDLENPVYYSIGNCVIERESGTLVLGCKNSTIPDDGSVRHIGAGAFSGDDGIEEITIPEGVLSLGRGAFSGCHYLRKITLPKSLRRIGPWTFSHCCDLAYISLQDQLCCIDDWAMYFCNQDLVLDYHGTVQQWENIYKSRGWSMGLPPYADGWKGVKAVRCTDGCILPTE